MRSSYIALVSNVKTVTKSSCIALVSIAKTVIKSSYIVLLIIVGSALGGGAGLLVDEPIQGAVAGGLLIVPFYQLFRTRRVRWLALALLIGSMLAAWRFVSPAGGAIALFCALVALALGADVLWKWSGGSVWGTMATQMHSMFGKKVPALVVSQGKIIAPKGDGPFPGPRSLKIKPNTAVITELETQYPHALGPGTYDLQRSELVKHVFDLQPQTINLVLIDVRTSEQLPVTVEMSILIGIKIPHPIRMGRVDMNDPADIRMPIYRRRLERIYDSLVDWQTTTKAEIESEVRSYVARFDIILMSDPARRGDLAQEVVTAVNTRVSAWGIWVDRAIVTSIQPVRSVIEKIEERWSGNMSRLSTTADERSRVEAWDDMVRSLAAGYQHAHSLGMPPDAINRLILMRMLERIIDEPDAQLNLSADILADLREIRRGLGFQP